MKNQFDANDGVTLIDIRYIVLVCVSTYLFAFDYISLLKYMLFLSLPISVWYIFTVFLKAFQDSFKKRELSENKSNRQFTEDEFKHLFKSVVIESVEGAREWFRDETDIIDNEMKKVLNNAYLDVRKDSKNVLDGYVYPRLEKIGIIVITEDDINDL